jgi:hypothetical protein
MDKPEEHARFRGAPFHQSTKVRIQRRLEYVALLAVEVGNGPRMGEEVVVAPCLN